MNLIDAPSREMLDFVEWLRNASPLDAPGAAFSQLLRAAHSSPDLRFERSPQGAVIVKSIKKGAEHSPATGNILFPQLPDRSCFWDRELDETLTELRDVAAEQRREVRRDNAIIRAIPTGLINGTAWALPSGKLIAIDDGLLVAIRFFIDAAVRFVPVEWGQGNSINASVSFSAFAEHLNEGSSGYAHLRSLLRGAFIYRNPMLSLGAPLEGPQDTLAQSLRRTAERFVVAHEYSHLLLGHLDRPSFSHLRRFTPELAVGEAVLEWQPELDADRLGVELALHAPLKQATTTGECSLVYSAYWAVGLLFGVISIMEEVLAPPASHPPAEARHAALREFLNSRCPAGPLFIEENAPPISALDLGWWLVRELWQRSRAAFYEDRHNPDPPVAQVMRYLQLQRRWLMSGYLSELEWEEFMNIIGDDTA